jgi:hypothetical protein
MTARLLTAVPGANPAVTQEALRRLASDADLQLIIKDHGQIVGVTAPTATIPARVRAAVAARDQGCRFPGCRMPIQFTDCHHVIAREDDGPTIISNLVALCRRHHTAVTEGRWKLTMTDDGTVTVRRGRRTPPPTHRASPCSGNPPDPAPPDGVTRVNRWAPTHPAEPTHPEPPGHDPQPTASRRADTPARRLAVVLVVVLFQLSETDGCRLTWVQSMSCPITSTVVSPRPSSSNTSCNRPC